MAVVQISKIQVRRGQKNNGIGIPQLSSAEFAWAVDTQELYIGNGSLAEGAPAVGNTMVLTEHTNILELASSYSFGGSNPSILRSVPRSLQTKLDEYVSILDFDDSGNIGDGSTDSVAAFEAAFEDLFSNTDPNLRKVLTVPNGHYVFSSALKIPSTAIIRGETTEGVILDIGINNIVFVTETGLELAAFTGVNRPNNIDISNLTIQRSTGGIVLTGIADSKFTGIKFKGEYELGDTVEDISTRDSAVYWENSLNDIKVDNISFNSCQFETTPLAIKCLQTVLLDTSVSFKDCTFFVNDVGVYVDGISTQGTNWTFDNCLFDEVANQAFLSTNGQGTLFRDCEFRDCGNGTGSAANPVVEIVSFGESTNNRLIDCKSNRHQAASLTEVSTTVGLAEAFNASLAAFNNRNHFDIYLSDSAKPLIALSAKNRYSYINYTLLLSTYTRAGKLTITVDENLSMVTITDEYQYSSPLVADPGGNIMTGFNFSAQLLDNNSDTEKDTILISYENPLATGASGTIDYSVSYGV